MQVQQLTWRRPTVIAQTPSLTFGRHQQPEPERSDSNSHSPEGLSSWKIAGTLTCMALFSGPNQLIKAVQFHRFKNLMKQHPEQLSEHFPVGLEGDTQLHQRLRWVIRSGDIPLLRNLLAHERARALDLNTGQHLSYHLSGIDSAILHLNKSPQKQNDILKVLVEHPKYRPAIEHQSIHAFNESPSTKRTLLYWAIEHNRLGLVRTILNHPDLNVNTVLNARNKQPGLQYMHNREIASDVQRWLHQHQTK